MPHPFPFKNSNPRCFGPGSAAARIGPAAAQPVQQDLAAGFARETRLRARNPIARAKPDCAREIRLRARNPRAEAYGPRARGWRWGAGGCARAPFKESPEARPGPARPGPARAEIRVPSTRILP